MIQAPPPADDPKTEAARKRAFWVRHGVDYGPLLAFLVAFVLTKNMTTATWVVVAASALALAAGFILEKRIAPLPLVAGLGGLVFGGLALVFHDPRLLKIKPTVLNIAYSGFLFGGLALKRNPLKVLLGEALTLPDAAWRTLTLRYGLYFLFAAGLNEIVWRTQSDTTWVWFKFPGLAILAILFSLTQAPFMMKHLPRPDDETPTAT